ncbi:GNAT family N-acetyltransferase [uncultured Nocardioides sp.]|uniref:GNAT family N-acetyltransferase n=1 Tax=uncultured Nocardioides sp. TaxID=198441 RepID=UPI0026077870|nr:GNAT family N-acetyltransferase [uncultured Nocardioides sp.]
MSDVLGICEEWTDDDLVVRTEDGALRRVPHDLVVTGKPVPPRSSVLLRVPAARLHRAGLVMWTGLETEPLGDWLLRSAPHEAARRANSTLAFGDPDLPAEEAHAAVVAFHTARGGVPVVAVEVGSAAHAGVEAAGWVRHRDGEDDTLVQVASIAMLRRGLPPEPEPSEVVEDGPRVALAVPGARGRAASDGDWLGLYGIETDPDHRRRGLALQVVSGLLARGAERGARSAYLQVHATNTPALALYERLGFVTHHAYRYLVPPTP